MPLQRTLFTLLLMFLLAPIASAAPLGRSFTYQGELSQSGTPIEGAVNLRFSLWDAASGGTQIGASQIASGILATKGLFTAEVNAADEFGAQAFSGEARWLQVEVCSDAGCTSTTVLDPRQAVTGAPYALGPWQTNGANLGYTGGSVGIGTTSPAYALHIKATGPAVILQDDAATSQQAGYVAFWNSNPTETGWMGYGTPGSPDMTIANARASGDIVLWASGEKLRVDSGGNVGVGTSAPASKLEVRGDIRLGASGEYFSPGGSENLRIVRGKVNAAGNVVFGTGFTSVRASTGVYNVTFNPHFPTGEWPVVTASAESNGSVARFAMMNTPTHITAVIRIVNGSGTAVDDDFYFIAVGTR
jgi:hypothetical protein